MTVTDTVVARQLTAEGHGRRAVAGALGVSRRDVREALARTDVRAVTVEELEAEPALRRELALAPLAGGLVGDDYLRAWASRAVSAWRSLSDADRDAIRARWAAEDSA